MAAITSLFSSYSHFQVDELTSQVQTMQLTVEDLEKERDFYFGKLRDMEVICQEEEGANSDLIQRILAILYATAVCI